MIFISFSNKAFNDKYQGAMIDMVIAPKHKYNDALSFLKDALVFLGEKGYPYEDYVTEYSGIHLKEGDYAEIVGQRIQSMDQSIDIKTDDIIQIRRIKCDHFNPLKDDFLVETKEEYIMFLWTV